MQGRQWFRSRSHTCAGMSLARESLCSFGWCAGRSRALLESQHLGLVPYASSSAPPPTWIHPPNSAGETKKRSLETRASSRDRPASMMISDRPVSWVTFK